MTGILTFVTLSAVYLLLWIFSLIIIAGSIIYIFTSGQFPTFDVIKIFFIVLHQATIVTGLFFGISFAFSAPMTKIWTNSNGKSTYHRWTPLDYTPFSRGRKLLLLFGHPILFMLLVLYCVVKGDYSMVKLIRKSMDEPEPVV